MANPDLEMSQAYARGDQGQGTVDFYLGYYAFQRPGAEVVYHANQLADGKRWVRASGGWQPLAITGLPARVQRERLTGDGRERLVLAWYWVGGTFTADARYAKLLQCRDRLLGRARRPRSWP